MSWLSLKNKQIYNDAFNALYEDTKTVGQFLINKTSEVAKQGYKKIEQGVTYLDKRYSKNNSTENYSNKNHSNNQDNISQSNLTELELLSDDTIHNNVCDNFCDSDGVIIDLSSKMYIKRIYIIKDGEKIRVNGKIASYANVDNIIRSWFEYEEINGSWRWIPSDKLMTAYRDSTSQLVKMKSIIFKWSLNTSSYTPYPNIY
jgi:hypothetical protein